MGSKHETILAIGAHPDDIEIGCAGYLLFQKDKNDADIFFLICTHEKNHHRSKEALNAYKHFSNNKNGIFLLDLPDGELHNNTRSLISKIEETITMVNPSTIITHGLSDLHADHSAVFNATLTATRRFNGSLLIYQSPSTNLIDGHYRPTMFFNLNRNDYQKKLDILKLFHSQHMKDFLYHEHFNDNFMTWANISRTNINEVVAIESFVIHKLIIISDSVNCEGCKHLEFINYEKGDNHYQCMQPDSKIDFMVDHSMPKFCKYKERF
jgi:LmbE family N-acetylglucosaminyl deacetylase